MCYALPDETTDNGLLQPGVETGQALLFLLQTDGCHGTEGEREGVHPALLPLRPYWNPLPLEDNKDMSGLFSLI